jgi:hypothetical protein
MSVLHQQGDLNPRSGHALDADALDVTGLRRTGAPDNIRIIGGAVRNFGESAIAVGGVTFAPVSFSSSVAFSRAKTNGLVRLSQIQARDLGMV